MQLIGGYGSPFVRRVGVTLHLYGLPFAHRPLATQADAAEIRALNPLGRVPALVLDNEVLIDSLMIVDWLDELAGPERALIPRAGPERRQVNRLVALAQGAAEKYVAAYYERARRPETHVYPPRVDWVEAQVAEALAALERQCVGPWLLGDRLTHADILLACGVLSMRLDMPHLAPAGRYRALDAVVAQAEDMAAFAVTRPSDTD